MGPFTVLAGLGVLLLALSKGGGGVVRAAKPPSTPEPTPEELAADKKLLDDMMATGWKPLDTSVAKMMPADNRAYEEGEAFLVALGDGAGSMVVARVAATKLSPLEGGEVAGKLIPIDAKLGIDTHPVPGSGPARPIMGSTVVAPKSKILPAMTLG